MNQYWIHESRIFSGEQAFRLMDEKGFPIDVCMELCAVNGMVIGWEEFFRFARKNKNFELKKSEDKLFRNVTQYAKIIYDDEWWAKWMVIDSDRYKNFEKIEEA